jgi:ABC-type dipeptide/oligopeptide/nickel transport system permease component
MLNMEGLSAEAKIGKILILVAVILSILVIIVLGFIAGIVWSVGQVTGFGIMMSLPQWILIALIILKLAGTAMGIVALYYAGRDDFSRAGIFAVVSCVLPPLDLVMLIGGIFCLIGREANTARSVPSLQNP